MPAHTSLTLKFKPRATGADEGRWYLWIRKPRPERDELIPVAKFTRRADRPAVEAHAALYRAAIKKGLSEPEVETCDGWYDRFILTRMGKVSTADTDHKQWLKHIAPIIGTKPIADLCPDDVEAVRDYLDGQIDAWEAAGKKRGVGMAFATAANVWAILTTACRHAFTRKGHRDLRVKDSGTPCENIPPPRRGAAKRRHWLRSAWLNAALAASPDMAMNEAVAIGVGLHLRPGELHELRVRDLDLVAGEVRIHRSHDERTQKTKGGSKTDEGTRTVSIPAWLAPLLERIAADRKPNDRVAPWVAATVEGDRALAFRAWLKSGDAPAYLFEETETHEPVDFRTIRDTGITLRFLGGERAEVVQRESGHRHVTTTLGYAKEVANKGTRYGDAFLTLPEALAPAAKPVAAKPVAAESGSHVLAGSGSAQCAITPDSAECEPGVNPVNFSAESFGKMVARVGFEGKSISVFSGTYPPKGELFAPDATANDRERRAKLTRLAAKARIVEALAEEVRVGLEELAGPSADVIPLRGPTRR